MRLFISNSYVLFLMFALCYGVIRHMFGINIVHYIREHNTETRASLGVFECPLSDQTFDLLRSLYFRSQNVE